MAGFNSYELTHKAFLLDSSRSKQGNDVVVKGNRTTDYPASGGKRLPAGAVVVKKTADGLYYLANDASNGDRNTAAVVNSAENPDNDWKDKTLTWHLYARDGSVHSGTVVASGGDENSAATWATLLNADLAFRSRFVASDVAGVLRITALELGAIKIRMTLNLSTAYGTISGSDSYTEASGTDADYRVVTQHRDTVDLDGASFDTRPVPTLIAGRFDESELSFLTSEAKAVFQGRGSTFE